MSNAEGLELSPNYPRNARRVDAGALLAAAMSQAERDGSRGSLGLVVVTTSLRAAIEAAGDHWKGLRNVRRHLARIGDEAVHAGWSPGYFGKDLVLTASAPGSSGAPRFDAIGPILSGVPPERGVETGWST